MPHVSSTVPQLLDALRTLNPTAPRLTWYGPDSERVELSGRVLENWVAKTANFLADELDAEPGTVVALDVPVHWRSLVWLLATWSVGATAVAGGLPAASEAWDRADIVATTEPAAAAGRLAAMRTGGTGRNPVLVAVALPALAMRWMGALPDGAVDYSGEVRSHADVFHANDEPPADGTAWETSGGKATFAGLLAPAAGAGTGGGQPAGPAQGGPTGGGANATGPQRVLLEARDGWDGVVRAALQAWAAGGSVVLLDPSVEATDRMRSTENVTRG